MSANGQSPTPVYRTIPVKIPRILNVGGRGQWRDLPTKAPLTAPWIVPLELTWFLPSVRREVTDPFVADMISASVRRKSVWLRRQQLLRRGGVEGTTIDWTVAFHSLPDSSYMVQLGRGHCDLLVVPDQIVVEAMNCRQQRGNKRSAESEKKP